MRPTTSVPEHGLAASHFVVAPHEGRTLLMTPRESGFSMPAEWAPHSGCWMAWPSRTDLWGGNLGAVQQGYVAVASAIAQFEPVWMVASPDAAQAARHACGPSIRVIPLSIDDAWIRDSGPTFLTHPARGLAGTAWRFNAWGGKSSRYADDARLAGVHGLHQPAAFVHAPGPEVGQDLAFASARADDEALEAAVELAGHDDRGGIVVGRPHEEPAELGRTNDCRFPPQCGVLVPTTRRRRNSGALPPCRSMSTDWGSAWGFSARRIP